MQTKHRDLFTTITTEGAILPSDLLQQIAEGVKDIPGLTSEAYHLSGEKLNEAISRSFNRMLGAWSSFQSMAESLPADDRGTTLTRERWLLPLFNELAYGRLLTVKAAEMEGKTYPISHGWQHAPIHLISFRSDLDSRTEGVPGAAKSSPHALVQEFLNRSKDHLWGFVSNGLRLRILRDNISLTRQAYVEFDLEAMMRGEVYADFVLLWLLCHQSRVESDRPETCWLEKWSKLAADRGTRALDQLRVGVEQAISALGRGFLSHPANKTLREKLKSGSLTGQDYYRQLLRLVYRLLFLFVAEDRGLLLDPKSDPVARDHYQRHYSTTRLRNLAQRRGTRHVDLWRMLSLVMEKLDSGCPDLGLPALGSYLWSKQAAEDLLGCEISNTDLLESIRALAYTIDQRVLRPVDYKNLGAEELGSIYESLLELHPEINTDAATFSLKIAGGHERKTTGSYYTPTSLITCLLDSALDPVVDEAVKKKDPEKAILSLRVCDPACGSGHFLIAAAHRLAKRLASLRTGDEEPAPDATRVALREVIGRCIYGVDINSMAVELCKVGLWMEALEPGKPLSFLDHRIQCGNSLLGATPALLEKGIPDEAFKPIKGDDKKFCSEWRKRNKKERETKQETLFDATDEPWDKLGNIATSLTQILDVDDTTIAGVRKRQELYEKMVKSSGYLCGRLWADAWCASFVWKKKKTDALPYPITEDIFRKIEQNPHSIQPWMRDEIVHLADQYKFFHWHLSFPDVFTIPAKDPENTLCGWSGGFDVVLGNPPWERIKIQEKEWFSTRKPEIAEAPNAAARHKIIQNLAQEDPNLLRAFMDDLRRAEGESQFVRDSGRYSLCGIGNVNTYAVFAEHNRTITSQQGRAGFIVPTGIVTDHTTKRFFEAISNNKQLASFFSFENEEFIFPCVHHAFRFALMTVDGSGRSERTDFVFFARNVGELQHAHRHFSLATTDFIILNPNSKTCPTFRSRRDADLNLSIYRRAGILIRDDEPKLNPWNIEVRTRLWHMAEDSELFRIKRTLMEEGWSIYGSHFIRGNEKMMPLLEAKMMHHFDHRFGTYEGQTEAQKNQGKLPELNDEDHRDADRVTLPYYWVPADEVEKRLSGIWDRPWLLGWREVTGSTVLRTVVTCIVSRTAVGHKFPLIFPKTEPVLVASLYANLCSYVLDYAARQKVGGLSLSYFILKQLPILPPSIYAAEAPWSRDELVAEWMLKRTLELTYTSWDIESFARDVGYKGPAFSWEPTRRFLLRCELDAAFFHLYGLTHDDAAYILDTFPIVKRKDEEEHDGDYRTKRVILEVFDAISEAIYTGKPYQTILNPPPASSQVTHSQNFRSDRAAGKARTGDFQK